MAAYEVFSFCYTLHTITIGLHDRCWRWLVMMKSLATRIRERVLLDGMAQRHSSQQMFLLVYHGSVQDMVECHGCTKRAQYF